MDGRKEKDGRKDERTEGRRTDGDVNFIRLLTVKYYYICRIFSSNIIYLLKQWDRLAKVYQQKRVTGTNRRHESDNYTNLHGPTRIYTDLHWPTRTYTDLQISETVWVTSTRTYTNLHGPTHSRNSLSHIYTDLHIQKQIESLLQGPTRTYTDLHGPSHTETVWVTYRDFPWINDDANNASRQNGG